MFSLLSAGGSVDEFVALVETVPASVSQDAEELLERELSEVRGPVTADSGGAEAAAAQAVAAAKHRLHRSDRIVAELAARGPRRSRARARR